ncbi:DNA-directed RNA polymerase subunit beta [Lacticaseibacillus daqingensis]|nr:DNA-directed RNA polymerase subunit beta [Lacticaseibacillus daqingensis]
MKHLLVGLLLILVALIGGSMIGYAIGGGNPWRVFAPSTWTHIFDFLS